ncbi:hypothetical protein WR25_18133 [Diploscapter pachys]|uniref:Uncharacterized protein n=1 Tax=Diploscapter pachys TaxID=2018661 RepID=A0A2A2JGA0_9BILA|nr:hypothetical protein WR25_18133 [Diploscapter pachys]
MNGTTHTTSGYAKYQIKGSGIPLMAATENEVFSLDNCEDNEEERKGNSHLVNRQEAEKSRLVECPLDSDEEKDSEEAKPKTEASQSKRRENNRGSEFEKSRLTGEVIDCDADSLSDDLDLLPPIPGAPNANSSLCSKLHRYNCCNPRIPNRCSIM